MTNPYYSQLLNEHKYNSNHNHTSIKKMELHGLIRQVDASKNHFITILFIVSKTLRN